MLESAQEASDGLKNRRNTQAKAKEEDDENENTFQVGALYVIPVGVQLTRNSNKLALDDQCFALKGGSSGLKMSPRFYNELVQSGLGAQSQRFNDPSLTFKKSMSFDDIITHLWQALPLLMEHLDDDNSVTANPFHPTIYRNDEHKFLPTLLFFVKEGRSLEHVGNQLLFPNGRDLFELCFKSKKTGLHDRILFLATLETIPTSTQRLWRTATIFSREQAIDPVVALERLKAQDETAKKDRKGKGKALFFLASDSGSSESSNELEPESPAALSSTQKLKRKRSSVDDEALEERNSKRPKTSLAKEYIEISDLDENSAKVRFTDSEDEEESSEGVNDHGDLKDPGIEDRGDEGDEGDEGEDSPGFKKVEVSLKDKSRRSSSSSGSSTASSEQDAGKDRVDEDDDDEEEDSWDNWT
ncbi:uncharacterized protein C8R40DRAFT_1262495 [Lentinula edodes]|uniref:uncharacterized protein n=1 Tax=Lentinula edodes TaxID=5353 RepID=UPI001E8E43F5|nr:uncharacterized protein C8R40DRAFT_1262495 [Lentinula edodes]KAH7879741.1 hypothetical protein C8R40DRAFT_1262495 [Lentinula edodes]